ncbi:hypothetical protein LIA77_02280 [Sarocladium implicatum]|nr:hypothetical protein LIA77_02280 [Sarocladium implicatum]
MVDAEQLITNITHRAVLVLEAGKLARRTAPSRVQGPGVCEPACWVGRGRSTCLACPLLVCELDPGAEKVTRGFGDPIKHHFQCESATQKSVGSSKRPPHKSLRHKGRGWRCYHRAEAGSNARLLVRGARNLIPD